MKLIVIIINLLKRFFSPAAGSTKNTRFSRLSSKDLEELKSMARSTGLRGWSTLKKPDLIRFIIANNADFENRPRPNTNKKPQRPKSTYPSKARKVGKLGLNDFSTAMEPEENHAVDSSPNPKETTRLKHINPESNVTEEESIQEEARQSHPTESPVIAETNPSTLELTPIYANRTWVQKNDELNDPVTDSSDWELWIEDFVDKQMGRLSISEVWKTEISNKTVTTNQCMKSLTQAIMSADNSLNSTGTIRFLKNDQDGKFIKLRLSGSKRVVARIVQTESEKHVYLSRPLSHEEGERLHNDISYIDSLFSGKDRFLSLSKELRKPRFSEETKHTSHAFKEGFDVNSIYSSLEGELGEIPYSLDHTQLEKCLEDGPVLVSGSAGSGKTTIGIYRLLAPLITDETYSSPERAYITYTETLKSSAEAEFKKLSKRNKSNNSDVVFLTIDDLCREIVGDSYEYKESKRAGYQQFKRYLKDQRNHTSQPLKAFEEYRGVLRAHGHSGQEGIMPLEKYMNIERGRSLYQDSSEKHKIYSICESYEKYKKKNNQWDDIDLVTQAMTTLMCGNHKMYDELVIDEAQDLTLHHFELIARICKYPRFLYITGDDQQIIFPSRFQWHRAKDTLSKVFEKEMSKDVKIKKPVLLKTNYRCSKEISEFSQNLWNYRHNFEKTVLQEKNRATSSTSIGVRSVSKLGKLKIEQITKATLEAKTERSSQNNHFSPDLMIITTDEYKKEAGNLFGSNLVYSINECKGLESTWVILWKIVHSERDLWNTIEELDHKFKKDLGYPIKGLLSRFNVATSRAKDIFYLADDWLPEWKVLSETPFLNQSSTIKSLRDILDIEPESDSFLSRAIYLEKQGVWEQASKNYAIAGDEQGKLRCMGLLQRSRGNYAEAAKQFLSAREFKIAFETTHSDEAAAENNPELSLLKFKSYTAFMSKSGNLDLQKVESDYLNPQTIQRIPGCAHFLYDLESLNKESRNPLIEKYVKKRIDRLSFFANKISNLHRKKDGSLSTLNKQLVELNDKFKALSQELGK